MSISSHPAEHFANLIGLQYYSCISHLERDETERERFERDLEYDGERDECRRLRWWRERERLRERELLRERLRRWRERERWRSVLPPPGRPL